MNIINKIIEWLYLHQKNNLVYYDTLTGCHNRAYYDRVLKKKYIGKTVLVVFIDINNLKNVNDTFGHHAGSKYIMKVTNSLKTIKYISDICRYGGDEFLLLADADMEKEVLEELSKIKEISYGCDIKGIYQDFSECINIADGKMYKMKLDLNDRKDK